MKTSKPARDRRPPPAASDLRRKAARASTRPAAQPAREAPARQTEVDGEAERLDARWQAATASGGAPLPDREHLEQHLGAPLDQVRVFSGAPARSLLDRLGARAATRGQQIVVRDDGVDAATLVHEVVHAVQSRSAGSAASSSVVAASAPAEAEAERIAMRIGDAQAGPSALRIRERLPVGAIALRRSELPASSETSLLDYLGPADRRRRGRADDGDEAPERRELARDRDEAPGREPEATRDDDVGGGPTEAAAARDDGEPSDARAPAAEGARETPAQDDAAREPAAETDTAREPAAAAAQGDCVMNPRQQYETFLRNVQDAWDRGSSRVQQTRLEPCGSAAVGPGERPYARGPPEADTPPASRSASARAPPELPTAPRDDQLQRARTAADGALTAGRGPSRAPAALTEEQQRTQLAQQRAVRRELDDQLRDGPARAAEPPVVRTVGPADPEHARRELAQFNETESSQRHAARRRTERDFGERRLAPARDPTTDHDYALNGVTPREVATEQSVGEDRLARIPNDDNVGSAGLGELAVVREAALREQEATHEEQLARAQTAVDDELARGGEDIDGRCQRGGQDRDGLRERAGAEVDRQREDWRSAIDGHAETRRRDAEALTSDGLRRSDQIREDTDRRARETMTAAQQDADRRWTQVGAEARRRAAEPSEPSLLERAVRAFRSVVNAIVRTLQDFIAQARRAITALLEAARTLAHAIVERGRAAIVAVIQHVRDGLRALAQALPGELGRIARQWQQRMDQALAAAQERIDAWAQALHQAIDEGFDALIAAVQAALDALAAAVDAAAAAIDTLLSEGLMAFLRANFPALAALIDEGLAGPIADAAAAVDGWAQDILESSGLLQMQQALQRFEQAGACEELGREQYADFCEQFERMLEVAMDELDSLMSSPFAQEIQQAIEAANASQLDQQTGTLFNLFQFAQSAASQVLEWWDAIVGAITSLYAAIGSFACAVWRHIASFLGLPPNLDPITALRMALEALWLDAIETIRPFVDELLELWRWIKEDTFVADILAFVDLVRQGWRDLVRLWDLVVEEGEQWLAEMAQRFQSSIVDPIVQFLGSVGEAINGIIDGVRELAQGLLAKLDALRDAIAQLLGLESLVALVAAILSPIRALAVLAFDCFLLALRGVAWMVANLGTVLHTIANLLVGVAMAFMAPPLSFVTFLGGVVWLYLVPECMKGPLLDAIIMVLLRIVEFFPLPNDLLLAVLYEAVRGFLQGLLDAPRDQKVRAVDLVARVFAGDVEIAAGMVVGFLEAIWDSTIGLIIDLLRLMVWLMSLPLRLVGLVGGGDEDTEQDQDELDLEAPPEPEPAEEAQPDESVEFGAPRDDDVGPDGEPTGGPEADTDAPPQGIDLTRPPELPPEVQQIHDILQAFAESRITREQVQALLLDVRDRIVAVVHEHSARAAGRVLGAMTAGGAGFAVGRVIGYVYGLVVVLVVLALLTGGVGSVAVGGEVAAASSASAAGRAAQAARGGAGMARAVLQALRSVRPMLRSVLNGIDRVTRGALRPLAQQLQRWMGQMMRWLQAILGRARRLIQPLVRLWRRMPRWLQDNIRLYARWRLTAGLRVRAAWRQLSAMLGGSMMEQGQLRAWLLALRLELLPTMPRGTTLSFRVEEGPGEEQWRLKCKVKRSLLSRGAGMHWTTRLMSASSRAGPGWRALDREGDAWFSTADDQHGVHDRVVELADRLLERALDREAQQDEDADLRELHGALRDDVGQVETQAGRSLLEHVILDIDQDRFEVGDDGGIPQLVYEWIISPNTSSGEIHVAASGASGGAPTSELEGWRQFQQDVTLEVRANQQRLAREHPDMWPSRQEPQARGTLTELVRRLHATSDHRSAIRLAGDGGSGVQLDGGSYSVMAEFRPAGQSSRPASRIIRVPRLATGREETDAIPIVWNKPFHWNEPITLDPNSASNWPRDPPGDWPRTIAAGRPQLVDIPNTYHQTIAGESSSGGVRVIAIGIDGAWRPRIRKTMRRVRAPRAETNQRRIRGFLGQHYQVDWGSKEADHVQDLRWGGADMFANLWPLERSLNNAANAHNRQSIVYESRSGDLVESTPDDSRGLYFQIRAVAEP
ncbi:MAG: DUF4157 domain-containing protein [Nannocystaceae bacterium]